MAFVDHDLHIHSSLSPCSGELGITQTPANILKYAEDNNFNTICVTDHFWDGNVPCSSEWYRVQDYRHISSVLPLPRSEHVRFLFGCEVDMDRFNNIGLAPQNFDKFDFIVISTTHLHMSGFTCRGDEDTAERAALWCSRLDYVLEQNLPFYKLGIAHLTDTGIMSGRGYLDVLAMISDEEYIRLFRKAADRGVGIELNFNWLGTADEDMEIHLRPYRIAKDEGCRFYLGSDAHTLLRFENMKQNFEKITDALALDDSHKFVV